MRARSRTGSTASWPSSRSSGAPRPSSPGGSSRRGTRRAPTGRPSTAIVAFGENGARPHAKLRDVPIPEGTLVVVDAGCSVDGYASDCTRTFFTGQPDGRLREIYDLCLQAQLDGLAAIHPGAVGRDVDAASRVAIEAAGMGDRYGHGLGHGVGLDVHEEPNLRPESSSVLEIGNVVTVEPGIYLSGDVGRPDRGHGRRHRGRLRAPHGGDQGARRRRLVWAPVMADIVNTNQFRNGMHIEHRGSVWRIVEFQHVKPGKGGAFVRTKLKNLETGAVVDDTFRAGEKFPRVHTEVKSVQFLYDDGSEAHFMDQETYEQFALPRTEVADELAYMLPSSTVQILQVNGKPSGLQLPASVELAVAETEPGVRGDTVSNVTKPATLETGAVVQVPLFVDIGERIKVDPREARYISRA